MAARRRSSSRAAALPARAALPALARFAPSRRSMAVGVGLFVAAALLFVLARETSLFAVSTVEVQGGTPAVRAEVRAALAGDVGRSLLRIDGGDLAHRLDTVPDVASFRYDRRFPSTLRVVVRAESPALVLRRGTDAYLVSTTARVLRVLHHPRASSLPRAYVPAATQVAVGEALPADVGGAAAAAVAAARAVGFSPRIHLVEGGRGALTAALASGFQVRLGDPGDLRLKLTIAGRLLATVGGADAPHGYLDVSVPERPVLSTGESQVAGRG